MAATLGSLSFRILVSIYAISLALANDRDQFVFYNFSEANLYFDGVARILSDGQLQLTNTSQAQSGHAFYRFPLDFNTTSTGSAQSLSFSTEFVFTIIAPEKEKGGHGLAFVVSPTTDLRYAAKNSFLGLFNHSSNQKPTNHMLAIELDIALSSEWNDISDNHVGIDVNSIVSLESANASYFSDQEGKNVSLKLASGDLIQIWIDYDGVEKILNVTLAPAPVPRPSLPLLSKSINLSEIFLDQMYVGFSASTGVLTSDQYILGWSFNKVGKAQSLEISKLRKLPPRPPPPAPTSPSSPLRRLAIIIPAAVVFFTVISGIAAYLCWKKMYEEVLEEWEKEYSPQRYSFRTLYKATKGFKVKDLLGSGGFGQVYKGELPSGTQAAVKKVSHDAQEGMKQFVAEIVSMGRLRHKNLVQLLGYCRRKGELLLVYEYMPNGSLDDYLFDDKKPKNLSWSQRFHIIKGVASALLYLHEEWEQVVLHRDIKASNVLLDADLNGRLGDFGLARFHNRGTNLQTTRVVGTVGYMAPELTTIGLATTSTDVYALGAFMLEVVCGRRPVDPLRPREEIILVKRVVECGRRGGFLDAIDPKLEGDHVLEETEMVLKLGLLCSQFAPEARPSMREVVQYLEGNATLPDIPF